MVIPLGEDDFCYFQVQHEILQKRRQEKKETLEAVKKLKRGRGGRPSFLGRSADTAEEEDHFPVTAENFTPSGVKGSEKRGQMQPQKSKKRVVKVKEGSTIEGSCKGTQSTPGAGKFSSLPPSQAFPNLT